MIIMTEAPAPTGELRKGLIAFGIIAILTINALLAGDLYRQRSATLNNAMESADLITVGLTQYTNRSLDSISALLDNLSKQVSDAHGPIALEHSDISDILNEAVQGPVVANLIVINSTGRWVNSAVGPANLESNLADRDYFHTHRLMPDDGLFLGQPAEAQTSGMSFSAASRALTDEQGRFLGVIAAILDPNHYRSLFQQASQSLPATIALVDHRGAIVTSVGELPDGLLAKFESDGQLQEAGRSRKAAFSDDYFVIHRPVGDFPLSQVVTVDTHAVLGEWRTTVIGHLLMGAGISLLLIFGLWLLWREMQKGERAQRKLRESESRFRSLIESTTDYVWEMDEDGYNVYSSPQVEEIMGYKPEEVMGMRPYDPMTPREQDRLTDIYHSIIESREPFHLLENRNVHKEGHEVVLETSGTPIFDEDGKFRGYRGIDRDITERKRLEEALRTLALLTGRETELEFFQLTTRNLCRALGMQLSLLIQETGEERHRLRAYHDDRGSRREPPLPNTLLRELHRQGRLVLRQGANEQFPRDPLVEAMDARSLFASVIRLADDSTWGYLIALDAKPLSRVRASRVEPILDVFSSRISLELDRNQAQANLSWEARHDSLTGMLNRRAFDDHLRHMLAQPPEGGRVHTLIYMDLDQFKVINDTCGHMAGDELLRQLSKNMNARLRKTDMLARLGGDEFGLLLADCPLERSMDIAETLLETVRHFQFTWEGRVFSVGASIGITHTREAIVDRSDLLAQADLACYAAKDLGRNRVQVYQRDNVHIQARHGEMGWVPRLDRALTENRFELYGQWIISINPETARPPTLEILLRLRDENGEMVLPAEFIPAAERYNLMGRIDRHVIDKVVAMAAHMPDAVRPQRCSINLSGSSMDGGGLTTFIEGRFAEYDVDPSQFCFELTETAAITNFDEAQMMFKRLRTLGCRVGLDDFGSGLSSFAYLRQIELDALKIDGSFVRHITDDQVSHSMVRAMHDVGRAMRLVTVAEFVEDENILRVLQEMGVDMAQGFALHKPQPLHELDPPPNLPGQASSGQ
ncbi:diguanylate cyclase (GGDEF)-like protein/PAS domain S-box-containing protein [Natronospira proteinivora]|uniref:Diguanylate cyclase (GGDEF)-like protein/PAS domain S-box-containing protein n=1 Tax=Natronospira proteinivora TaxID=1807133 RepID=A0ABT1G4G2_9GAMM|nr:EAL domain-containing protein [Natronospira proteinivora]MCP1726186.1 diguanylate cyclase (GGDEF)-like protein/PAS domain S-box-containing protein [Natronospira proteinivora]